MHFPFLHTLQIYPFFILSPMETRFKLRLSRIFHSSFSSCRSRNLSDIIPPPYDATFPNIQPLSPPDSAQSCLSSSRHYLLPHRKISHHSPSPSAIPRDLTFPPPSPIFPENTTATTTNKKKKKQRKQRKQRKKVSPFRPFNSSWSAMESNFGGTWWYSSEDDDETDTLFSSKSRSSDSSASHGRRKSRRRRCRSRSSGMGLLPLRGKVKDSFAVVKKSSDPYNDFRISMVEMIVQKQIFSGEDLEQLLQCFLSLNSHHHHNVILEVFTEIWEALFSDWGS